MSRFGSLWNLPVRTDDAFGHNMLLVPSGSFLPHFQGFQNFAETYLFKGLFLSHVSLLNMSPETGKIVFKMSTQGLESVQSAKQGPLESPLLVFRATPYCSVCLKRRKVWLCSTSLGRISSEGCWLFFLGVACEVTSFEGAERTRKYGTEVMYCLWNYLVSGFCFNSTWAFKGSKWNIHPEELISRCYYTDLHCVLV